MNIPWTVDPGPQGSLEFEPPKSKPGDYIVMRAEMDCIIAFSACPQVWLASCLACNACILEHAYVGICSACDDDSLH